MNSMRLLVIEDAAQAVNATYKGRALGSLGQLGCFSFHETKNYACGEGGALCINDPKLIERAEIIREKGTNRSRFLRGQVDKYTWIDIGSSYLPGEIVAAFLWAQMEEADAINKRRLDIWSSYHSSFANLENAGHLRRPVVPNECVHNAHMYYLLLPSLSKRTAFIERLKSKGVHTVFHYIPLHSSPHGQTIGRVFGEMKNTDITSDQLVRLPLWLGLENQLGEVIAEMVSAVL